MSECLDLHMYLYLCVTAKKENMIQMARKDCEHSKTLNIFIPQNQK